MSENCGSSGVVCGVVVPLVIGYTTGGGSFSGIVGRPLRLLLQSSDGSFEVEDLPESDSEIQNPHTTYCAANPTGSDHCLEPLNACLAGCIQQKIVVAPVA